MKVDLVVRFAPIEDEASLGYYRRLAARNALLGWKELARMCEVSVSRSGILSRPEYIANALGLDVTWTRDLALREARANAWKGLLRSQLDAICPKCLSRSIHIRDYWEHGYVTVCAEHETCLIDKCPNCMSLLSPNRAHIEYCQCGQDLRILPTQSASTSMSWLANLMQSRGRTTGNYLPSIKDVNPLVLSNLVKWLCVLADPQTANPRRNAAAPRTIAEANEFLSPLESILAEWPKGFEAHIRARIAVGDPTSRTLNGLLGRWYVHLKVLAAQGPLREFLSTAVNVASTEYQGVIGLDGVIPTAAAGGFLLVSDAAVQMKVGRSTLMGALLEGNIVHRKKKFGARGYLYEVAESEIERVAGLRSQWLTEEQACAALGVPPAVLQYIVDAELLTVDTRWRSNFFKGGGYAAASVDAFSRQLASHVEKRNHAGGRISLQELNARRLGDRRIIVKAIRGMYTGEIHALGPSETAGSLQFELSDIQKYSATTKGAPGLTVQHLSELTGWKWESISYWIESGLLDATAEVSRGQPCRVVSPAQLLQFTRQYIPLADLARAGEVRPSYLIELLPTLEVIGAKPLPNGQQRGGLVRLSDLVRLATACR